jgi:hypothetical protein
MEPEPTYLIDAGQEREALAAWRLLSGFHAAPVFENLGIPWPAGWCLLRFETPLECNVGGDALVGDIDVLAGRLMSEPAISAMPENLRTLLSFQFAGRISRPAGMQLIPDFSYLIGIEVKCAYVRAEALADGRRTPVVKSLKKSTGKHHKLKKQLEGLLGLGLDKVILLDVTAGIPSEATTIGEAVSWTALSAGAVDHQHERLIDGFAVDLPIGHFEATFGPKLGTTEDVAGFFRGGLKRAAPDNPWRSRFDVASRRRTLVEHLQQILPTLVQGEPHIPVLLDQCPRCKRIGPYHGLSCPDKVG